MASSFVLMGAYGREYDKVHGNEADIEKDWNAEKDFLIVPGSIYEGAPRWDGKPINRQQTKSGDVIHFVFGKNGESRFEIVMK